MIFLKKKKKKKNTRKYDIFFKRSEKIVFSKSASGNCLSCIIWKDGIFSRARYIFSLGGKWEMTFLKKNMEIWCFLFTRTGVNNATRRPSVKKFKDGVIPQQHT